MKPLYHKIQISISKPTAGSLDLSSKASAVECGEIIAVGTLVNFTDLEIGKKILFKAWACDVITNEGETYYFLDDDSRGICAIL